jgi:hypothetical protein
MTNYTQTLTTKIAELEPNKWYKCPAGAQDYTFCLDPFTLEPRVLPAGMTAQRSHEKMQPALNNGLQPVTYIVSWNGKVFSNETYVFKP